MNAAPFLSLVVECPMHSAIRRVSGGSNDPVVIAAAYRLWRRRAILGCLVVLGDGSPLRSRS